MPNPSLCDACPAQHFQNLVKLGINMTDYDFVIALAGNPNTGKSTVFNRLTGLRQHTGNWPGKTVARAEGGFVYRDKRFKLVDLPGTYSLLSTSADEEVARDFLLFGQPDVTIIVIDATRIERNLNLVLQTLEITDRAVVCLNLMDEARRNKLIIDDRGLAKDLGVPVIPASSRRGEGISELLQAAYEIATGAYVCKPYRIKTHSRALTDALESLSREIKSQFPDLPNARWVALRLLEGDQRIIDAIRSNELLTLVREQQKNLNGQPATE